MPVPVTHLQQATGLDKEVVRKWEIRYGFPRPLRDGAGERLYPDDQIAALRLIRRLLDAGMRPAKVVPLSYVDLVALTDGLSAAAEPDHEDIGNALVAILRRHDFEAVRIFFERQVAQVGLLIFVQDILPIINERIGDAWLRGDIRVYEEHLYSAVVQEVLNRMAATVLPINERPRILLTTPPEEHHALGLTMAALILRIAGATCINLGTQTPLADLCDAAEAFDVDAVGLSISIAMPPRKAGAFLRHLARDLRPGTAIWVGGQGSVRLPATLPRVVHTAGFKEALAALDGLAGRR
jgi:methylmalonyl-CoA mutase cobalamin-binding subunit